MTQPAAPAPARPRNPLARHIVLFLVVKAVLIGLGLWWFVATLPPPRGAIVPAAAAGSPPP